MNRKTPLKRNSYLQQGDSKLGARIGLKKSYYKLKAKVKTDGEKRQQQVEIDAMWSVFLSIWVKRGPYSEVSGVWLGNECRTVYCHHILPKASYPEYQYDEDNIILLTWEEHANVEISIYKYEEINNRRDKLKSKYGI